MRGGTWNQLTEEEKQRLRKLVKEMDKEVKKLPRKWRDLLKVAP